MLLLINFLSSDESLNQPQPTAPLESVPTSFDSVPPPTAPILTQTSEESNDCSFDAARDEMIQLNQIADDQVLGVIIMITWN